MDDLITFNGLSVAIRHSGRREGRKRLQLSATAEGFQVSRCIDGDKCAHASTIIRTPTPTKFRPLTLVEPPTRTLCETVGAQCPLARDQGLSRVVRQWSVPNGRWYSRIGRTTVRTSCSTSYPPPKSTLSPAQVKARDRPPDELRWPFMSMVVVCNSLEWGWVGRYGLGQGRRFGRLGAGGRVEFAGARRVRLTCKCNGMSYMDSFSSWPVCNTSFADLCCSRFSVSR